MYDVDKVSKQFSYDFFVLFAFCWQKIRTVYLVLASLIKDQL